MTGNEIKNNVLDKKITLRDIVFVTGAAGGMYFAYKGIQYFKHRKDNDNDNNNDRSHISPVTINGNDNHFTIYLSPTTTNQVVSSDNSVQSSEHHSTQKQQMNLFHQQSLTQEISLMNPTLKQVITNTIGCNSNWFVVAIGGVAVVSLVTMFHRDPQMLKQVIEALEKLMIAGSELAKNIAPLRASEGSLKIEILVHGQEARQEFLQHLLSDELIVKLNSILNKKGSEGTCRVSLEGFGGLNMSDKNFKKIKEEADATFNKINELNEVGDEVIWSEIASKKDECLEILYVVPEQDRKKITEELMRRGAIELVETKNTEKKL